MFSTIQRSRSLPITSTVSVAATLVQVSNQVRILVKIYSVVMLTASRLSFDAHISALCKSCFYHIHALRHIRSNLTLDFSKKIAYSLVGCRLDYANSTLVGSRLRTCIGFNVCKHARSCCHMSTGTHQLLQDFTGAALASYQVAHRL